MGAATGSQYAVMWPVTLAFTGLRRSDFTVRVGSRKRGRHGHGLSVVDSRTPFTVPGQTSTVTQRERQVGDEDGTGEQRRSRFVQRW